MTDERQVHNSEAEEPELYEEPPRMTGRDAGGVILALVALTVIGVAGYIWLTPGKGFADLLPSRTPQQSGMPAATAAPGAHEHSEVPHDVMEASAPAEETAELPAAAEPMSEDPAAQVAYDQDVRCAYCGMFADKSGSHAVAQWSDGSQTHHDCWDCLLNYGTEEGLTLKGATVVEYGSPLSGPRWLDAGQAWYLYETKAIKGSMPPYVAAFADRAAAEGAQAELGGEVVDFAGLRANWE